MESGVARGAGGAGDAEGKERRTMGWVWGGQEVRWGGARGGGQASGWVWGCLHVVVLVIAAAL